MGWRNYFEAEAYEIARRWVRVFLTKKFRTNPSLKKIGMSYPETSKDEGVNDSSTVEEGTFEYRFPKRGGWVKSERVECMSLAEAR